MANGDNRRPRRKSVAAEQAADHAVHDIADVIDDVIDDIPDDVTHVLDLSLIHISEPTRPY